METAIQSDKAVVHPYATRDDCMQFRTANYCEENVWHILNFLVSRGANSDNLFAVFISNARRCVPFQFQLSADTDAGGVCFWDYHVIGVMKGDRQSQPVVYDIDSTLPFPCSLEQYVREALVKPMPNGQTYAQLCAYGLAHMFRVVHHPELLRKFSTDRRHMRDDDGKYRAAPPPRPVIQSAELDTHSLPIFLDMSGGQSDRATGVLLGHVGEFVNYFGVRDASY